MRQFSMQIFTEQIDFAQAKRSCEYRLVLSTMPAYKIIYTRRDIKGDCHGLKWAHTPKEALAYLATGSEKTGYRLRKSGVLINIKSITENND